MSISDELKIILNLAIDQVADSYALSFDDSTRLKISNSIEIKYSQINFGDSSSHGSAFGDFSCAVPLRLASYFNVQPFLLAQKLREAMLSQNQNETQNQTEKPIQTENQKRLRFTKLTATAPGFINVQIDKSLLSETLVAIHQRFGPAESLTSDFLTDFLKRKTMALESANENLDLNKIIETYNRCCSLLQAARRPAFDLVNCKQIDPYLSLEQWLNCRLDYKNAPSVFEPLLNEASEIFVHQKALILAMDASFRLINQDYFADAVMVSKTFIEVCSFGGIFEDQHILIAARLGLVLAVKLVLEKLMLAWDC